ncbi:MAG: glycosyltransferase [Candidatus Omnitrophica bacterium]|nr:glycosyltransferase [Candidatus Omnitrophota bacterium]
MTRRGGEQVVEALAELFPRADIYTLVADRAGLTDELRRHRLVTSWLQAWPVRRQFRLALPLFPWLIERFEFTGYDLVISVSHAVAKGVRTNGVPHLCYCLTPMRYAWVAPETYWGASAARGWTPQGQLVRHLRRWDRASAARVTTFVAISDTVRRRIREAYDREAIVLHPPVDCARFEQAARAPQDYWLVVSALVPYKRTELAIEAFNQLRKPLVIVGAGPEERRLRRAAGPTVTFVGRQSPEALARWYAGARALIYPQEEDFGLAAVEAQAAGCPVVAFARGGATETVADGTTGIWFHEPTAAALAEAVVRCDQRPWDPAALRRHARAFDRPRFETAFRQLAALLAAHG